MKKFIVVTFVSILPFVTSGCWDRTELNDLAFKMALAVDEAPGGMTEVSAQIVVPAKLSGASGGGGGGDGQGYVVVSGTGRNTREAVAQMQTKVSRHITAGQRRGIFVSEDLAKNKGLTDVVDTNTRDPDTRLRTDLFVVEGTTAKELLKVDYPFERVPALAAVRAHQTLGGIGDTTFREFLTRTYDDSSCPTLPVIQAVQEGDTSLYQIGKRAIFNKQLKCIGVLDQQETLDKLWVTNQIKLRTLTITVPGHPGTVSMEMTRMRSKIKPILKGSQVQFAIKLSGTGGIRENDTSLDLTNPTNMQLVNRLFNEWVTKEVLQTIQNEQKEYGADVFGFGEAVHRRYPLRWNQMKQNWPSIYPNCEVTVQTKLTIQRIGLTGAFLETNGETQK